MSGRVLDLTAILAGSLLDLDLRSDGLFSIMHVYVAT